MNNIKLIGTIFVQYLFFIIFQISMPSWASNFYRGTIQTLKTPKKTNQPLEGEYIPAGSSSVIVRNPFFSHQASTLFQKKPTNFYYYDDLYAEVSQQKNGRYLIRYYKTHNPYDRSSAKNQGIQASYDVYKNATLLREIEVLRTPKDILKLYSPNHLNQLFKVTRSQFFPIISHKLKEFPMEAFTFFLAIGAVTIYEIVYNYSNDPQAMSNFLEMSKDPVGILGFAAFVITSGLVSEPFRMTFRNSKFLPFVGYLGMSAGMMASNIVHEIGHFPHLWECALKRVNCDQAYQAWLEYSVSDKLNHEWTPGLMSLLSSSVLSAALESTIRLGVKKSVQLIGIELSLLIAPSGWIVFTGKWILRLAQFTGFMFINHFIHEPILIEYNNRFGIADDLNEATLLLTERLGDLNQSVTSSRLPLCPIKKSPPETCQTDLANIIFNFHHRIMQWINFNLMSINNSHHQWLSFLSKLSFGYSQTKNLYDYFVTSIEYVKKEKINVNQDILVRPNPLFGIFMSPGRIPSIIDYRNGEMTFEEIQKKQILFLHQVAQKFFSSEEERRILSLANLEQKKLFQEIKIKVLSSDPMEIGLGIRLIRYLLDLDTPPQHLPHYIKLASDGMISIHQGKGKFKRQYKWSQLQKHLHQFYLQIGINPEPLLAPGEFFIQLFNLDKNKYLAKSQELKNLDQKFDIYQLFNQMIFGPTPQSNKINLVKLNMSGFPINFIPPRLIKNNPSLCRLVFDPRFNNEPLKNGKKLNYHNLFCKDDNLKDVNLGNAYMFLIKQGMSHSLTPSHEYSDFFKWWDESVDQEIVKTLDFYKKEYLEIINKFQNHLKNYENHPGNQSGFSNNVAEVVRQVMNIYLSLSFQLPNSFKFSHSKDLNLIINTRLRLAPNSLKKIHNHFNKIFNELIRIVTSPQQMISQNEYVQLEFSLKKLHREYEIYLNKESNLSSREQEVLLSGVNELLNQMLYWAQIIKALDFQ